MYDVAGRLNATSRRGGELLLAPVALDDMSAAEVANGRFVDYPNGV